METLKIVMLYKIFRNIYKIVQGLRIEDKDNQNNLRSYELKYRIKHKKLNAPRNKYKKKHERYFPQCQ